ncbi:uncharacterized protein TrAtP1_000089 [Trichoderma atroviride]|uniref:uncharacterized protein n=1 Tax=Hypocrea atroviridis TaxID=63577 RepID=UPI00332E5773|nr:hypothetical protein TrAtP1_000089 [Trichoderma atroviride]
MPFISSNRPGSDELLQVEPLVWMLHAILKPRDEEYAWVQLDIYLMLPTLGRGINYTHHHVHDFPSTPSSSVNSTFSSGLQDSRPFHPPITYLFYQSDNPRHPEAVANSTPFLTRLFGCSRTLFFLLAFYTTAPGPDWKFDL